MVLIDVYECIGADGDGLDFCHSWHYFEISIARSVEGEREREGRALFLSLSFYAIKVQVSVFG